MKMRVVYRVGGSCLHSAQTCTLFFRSPPAQKDESWGGIHRVRHLKAVVGAPRLLSSSASPSPARNPSSASSSWPQTRTTPAELVDVATRGEGSDAPTTQDRGMLSSGLAETSPLRRAVIAHARSLSRALRLFDLAVSDGGTTKAVINGPVRGRRKRERERETWDS